MVPAGIRACWSRTTHRCSNSAPRRATSSWIARGESEYWRPSKLLYSTVSRRGAMRRPRYASRSSRLPRAPRSAAVSTDAQSISSWSWKRRSMKYFRLARVRAAGRVRWAAAGMRSGASYASSLAPFSRRKRYQWPWPSGSFPPGPSTASGRSAALNRRAPTAPEEVRGKTASSPCPLCRATNSTGRSGSSGKVPSRRRRPSSVQVARSTAGCTVRSLISRLPRELAVRPSSRRWSPSLPSG